MQKFVATFIWLLFFMTTQAFAQSFEATVNRNQIPEGETFLLTLEAFDIKSDAAPDLSSLQADFTTYSVSSAFRTNIVNGQVSQSRQWNLVLMPNKTGKLLIPALSLENYQSKPITIDVATAGSEIRAYDKKTSAGETGNKFAISGSVDNKNPYVQEQIIYTLKLTDRGGLQGEEPYFEGDYSDSWIIKSLGSPVVKSQIINGQTIRELTFKYAMFPQKSGKLTIPPVKFRGFYLTKTSRHDPYGQFFGDDIFLSGFGMSDVFATKNPIFLSTKPIVVDVKAALNGSKWWLPAQNVQFQAKFEGEKPTFKVGEAVTRTFYLKAVGVIDSQLPEISFPDISGFKQYPEKPETVMKIENDQVVSLAKIANVYIPSQNGELILPEVQLPWFNVKTGKAETARIPEQKVIVSGSLKVADAATSTPQNAPNTASQAKQPAPVLQYIYWLIFGAFLLGVLLCLVILKIFNKNAKEPKINPLKDIHQAAAHRDLRRLRDGLLLWAKKRYPAATIFSLKDVEDLVQNQAFSCELEKLGEALYAAKEADWNAELFLKTFAKVNKMKVKKNHDQDLLPKLYK